MRSGARIKVIKKPDQQTVPMTARPNQQDFDIDAGAARPVHAPGDHPPIATPKIGILLVNLGTPDAPTAGAVRRYLAEFLSDPRIVDYPALLWRPVLHGVILNVRPAKTARAYESIWLKDTDESPLRYFTREAAARLQARIDKAEGAAGGARRIVVDWAMRYGAPSVADRIEALKAGGCGRILVVPQYPQYSCTTTASVHDAVFDAVRAMRWHPALRFAPAFHDHPAYIEALRAHTTRSLEALDWSPERVILSFHGLPERYLLAGDPYHCHCAKTARLLRQAMGWSEEFAPLTFQSKFGPEKWLEPPTDDVIAALADQGVKRMAVVTPGFLADCLETLEEIGIAAQELFQEHGGEKFAALPCLNDSPEMITLLDALVTAETAGWRR